MPSSRTTEFTPDEATTTATLANKAERRNDSAGCVVWSTPTMEYVVTVLVAILSGAAGSVLAPWANYKVQARQERDAYRRQLIANWRAMIARHHQPGGAGTKVVSSHLVVDDPDFETLRPYVPPDFVAELESASTTKDGTPVVHVSMGGQAGLDANLRKLAEVVDALERAWKLV